MNKSLLILKNEVITMVTRRSFWFIALGFPVISFLVFAGVSFLNKDQSVAAAETLQQVFTGSSPEAPQPDGYVDRSGLIQSLPESVQPGSLVAFQDEEAADRALGVGEISAYYVVPQDYLESGRVIYVRPDYNPISAFDQDNTFEWVLRVNLLGGDERLASITSGFLDLQMISQAPAIERDEDNPMTFFLPYAVTMMFFMTILMSASFMLSSVAKEKENRILEVLMLSTTPRQLLEGKIVGLGLVGLLQNILWVGTGFILLRLSGQTFSLPVSFQLPVSFLVWALVFFLLGYGLYASLMAGVGALVPNLREASQATFVVILPLLIPLVLISVLIEEPNGTLAIILSLFPLTAPVVMMMRLAATTVPVWQPLLAATLMLGTLIFILRAVADMFRAQVLLSGQPFSLKGYLRALAQH